MEKTHLSHEVKGVIDFNSDQDNRCADDSWGRVVKAFNGYGKREGFFNKISGVFYRIWNAVKAIFGQSDWQLGSKAIQEKLLNRLNSLEKIDCLSEERSEEELQLYRDLISKLADPLLKTFVESSYITGWSTEEVNKEHEKRLECTIKKGVEPFAERIKAFKRKSQELTEDFITQKVQNIFPAVADKF